MLISWTWSLPSRVNLIQRRLSYQRRLQNLFRRVETSYGGQQYALMRLRGATLTMLTFLVTGSSLASTPMKSRRMLLSTSGGTAMRKYTISSPVHYLFIYLAYTFFSGKIISDQSSSHRTGHLLYVFMAHHCISLTHETILPLLFDVGSSLMP